MILETIIQAGRNVFRLLRYSERKKSFYRCGTSVTNLTGEDFIDFRK
jgi:hypothetical protein